MTQKTRIMIVDDNVDAAEVLSALLQDEDFEVRVTHDPFEALALAEDFKPDAAILDIGLPGMSGHELAKALKKEGKSDPSTLRLIALSGYGQASDRLRSLEAGFEAHFVKPVDCGELVAQLTGAKIER